MCSPNKGAWSAALSLVRTVREEGDFTVRSDIQVSRAGRTAAVPFCLLERSTHALESYKRIITLPLCNYRYSHREIVP